MDVASWWRDSLNDQAIIGRLLRAMHAITPEHDLKLTELKRRILVKVDQPINPGNPQGAGVLRVRRLGRLPVPGAGPVCSRASGCSGPGDGQGHAPGHPGQGAVVPADPHPLLAEVQIPRSDHAR